jgi:hypothetical protein
MIPIIEPKIIPVEINVIEFDVDLVALKAYYAEYLA